MQAPSFKLEIDCYKSKEFDEIDIIEDEVEDEK